MVHQLGILQLFDRLFASLSLAAIII